MATQGEFIKPAPHHSGVPRAVVHYGIDNGSVEAFNLFVDLSPFDADGLASANSLCVRSSTEMTFAFVVSGTLLAIHRSRKSGVLIWGQVHEYVSVPEPPHSILILFRCAFLTAIGRRLNVAGFSTAASTKSRGSRSRAVLAF